MKNRANDKNSMAEYMRAVGDIPLLTPEEENECSETILRCRKLLVRGLVTSADGINSILILFDSVRGGKKSVSYTLRKEDFRDDGDQKKDRTRTLALFDSFVKICHKKYKNENSRINRLSKILDKINLGIEDLGSLSKDTAVLKSLKNAQKRMTEGNLRLVMSVAQGFVGFGIPFEDLVQEGNLGLMRATEDYDHRCGNRFSTYAFYWIRQKISRCLMNKGRLIRVPANVGGTLGSVSEIIKNLFIEKQRKPTKLEIAQALGITIEKLDSLILVSSSPVSLDSPLFQNPAGDGTESRDARVGDSIHDCNGLSAEDVCDAKANIERLNAAISKVLTPREEMVIRLHFGIYPAEEMTLEEIGVKLGISKQAVHQSIVGTSTRQGALTKLKKHIKTAGYEVTARRFYARKKKKADGGSS